MTTYKLLTIDVWDTLLRRNGHPDLVKLQLCQSIILERGDTLLPEYQSAWSMLKLRQLIESEHAEKMIDAGRDGEYISESVLADLLHRSSRPGTAWHQPTFDTVHNLIDREYLFEIKISYPDPKIREFVSQFSYDRILFLSDFYWPSTRVQSLLSFHGFDDLVVEGICSCDIGLNKRSGRLFEYLHQQEGVAPSQHLHIGDNYDVDILMAKAKQSAARHFQPHSLHLIRMYQEQHFYDRTSLFNHICSESVETDCPAFNLGQRCAPLFVGFSLFLAEQAIQNSVDRIYFFTREGEFFLQVFNRLFDSSQLSQHSIPPAVLLEVSRLATFAASLETVNTDSLMRLWRLYSTQSLRALLLSLGFTHDQTCDLANTYKVDISRVIQYPWQDPIVNSLLSDESFVAHVSQHCQQRRAQLAAYLHEKDFISSNCHAVVDIGWRGTIQDNLAHCLPSQTIHGFYLGLSRFLNPQPTNVTKQSYGPNLNISQDGASLLDAVSGLEMLCNSPNGSVESYSLTSSGCSAVKRVDPNENAVYSVFTKHFQLGVLSACDVWSRYVDQHVITAEDLRPLALSIWHSLLHQTPQELADAYSGLSHNELFGVGGFIDKSTVPSIATVLLSPLMRSRRHDLVSFVRLTQWPSVVKKRRDLSLPHRAILVIVLVAGRIAKRSLARLRSMNAIRRSS